MNSERIAGMLTELGLQFTQDEVEPGVASFIIVVEPEENLEVGALLYGVEDDGEYLRLSSYVDELNEHEPLAQLRMLMELNVELPYGAFALEPEENYIFVTVNVRTDELSAEKLGDLIELLFVAQAIYDSELGLDGGEVVAQG